MAQHPSVHIDHFQAEYLVPADAAVSEQTVVRRLNTVAADMMARAWDDDALDVQADDALYFVEKVDADFDLDLNADDRTIAAQWAAALRQAIARTIARREGGLVRFGNRAEFIAAYIQDLLNGGAEHWYYAELRPRSGEGFAAHIVRLLVEDTDIGRDALFQLSERDELPTLFAAISEADAELVVGRTLLPAAPRLLLPGMYGRWLAAIRQVVGGGAIRRTGHAVMLARLYFGVVARNREHGHDVHLARFINDLLALRDAVAAAGGAGVRALAALERGDPEPLLALLRGGTRSADSAGTAYAAHGAAGNQFAEIVQALARQQQEAGFAATLRDLGAAAAEGGQEYLTSFGGLFLLLPAILDLDIEPALANAHADAGGEARDAHLPLMVLLQQAAGREDADAVRRDRALAMLCGFERLPARTFAERYESLIDTERFTLNLKQIAESLARSTSHYPRVAVPGPAEQQACMLGANAAGLPPETAAAETAGDQRGNSQTDNDQMADDEPAADADNVVAVPAVPVFDAELAPITAHVLKRFAAALGAFADSSPGYLRANFLRAYCLVEVDAATIVVRLLRCPLQLVLRMAGFGTLERSIPWLGNRTLRFEFV